MADILGTGRFSNLLVALREKTFSGTFSFCEVAKRTTTIRESDLSVLPLECVMRAAV